MSWFDDHASELEAAGISQEAAKDFAARNTNPDGSQDTHRLIEALTNDDVSTADHEVIQAAQRCAAYFAAQGYEVRRVEDDGWGSHG